MVLLTRRELLPKAAGAILLIGALLRIWHFAGGRSLWLDEVMVALDIKYLSPSELLGPLSFDQVAPAGWLLLEKACLYLWDNFDYSLRLPSLVGGIAALFLFYRFLKFGAGAWEALTGAALMAVIPVFIQYASMVKPYILDVLFSVALLYASLALLRAQGSRLGPTLLYGGIGILCIPLSFGGTLVMAGTGPLLFIVAIVRKERSRSLALAAVGVVWALLFWAIHHLIYAQNIGTIARMTGLYWKDGFAPVPASLDELLWYPRTALGTVNFLMSNTNGLLVAVIWLYGAVRLAGRDPWLPALLVGPVIVTLLASMLELYPFNTRLTLGLAPPLLFGLSSGAVGIVKLFGNRPLAALAMIALLGITPIKQTARAAGQVPPFPLEEIKPNLAYLKRHYRHGDQLVVYSWAEPAFILYADRFGLSDIPYKVTSNFHLDPSCVYDDVRMIGDKPRVWLLFYHVIYRARPDLRFLERALRIGGTLKLVNTEPGSSLYEYTAGDGTGAMRLPLSAAICAKPPIGKEFLERIAPRLHSREAPPKTRAADVPTLRMRARRASLPPAP
jgi:hypothetical protein